jgi:hypothetical protein
VVHNTQTKVFIGSQNKAVALVSYVLPLLASFFP